MVFAIYVDGKSTIYLLVVALDEFLVPAGEASGLVLVMIPLWGEMISSLLNCLGCQALGIMGRWMQRWRLWRRSKY